MTRGAVTAAVEHLLLQTYRLERVAPPASASGAISMTTATRTSIDIFQRRCKESVYKRAHAEPAFHAEAIDAACMPRSSMVRS